MASLTQVAQAAGVSLTTASMVLNKTKQHNRVSAECAARVKAVAKSLGYVPNYHARSMKLGRAEMIAVAMDVGFYGPKQADIVELGGTYFGQLIGAMELEARVQSYQLTIVGPDKRHRAPDRGVVGIRQRRFDGLIVPGYVVRTDETNFLSESPEHPIVVVQTRVATALPVIDFDEAEAMRLAIGHLASLGHRDLLWVNWGSRIEPDLRETHFIKQVWDAGLRGSSLQVTSADGEDLSIADPGVQVDAIEHRLAEHVQQRGRQFTAIVAYNDVAAIGCCAAMRRLNLHVPRDVSVVGFDDVEARLCIPRLTTISHRLAYMGRRATTKLLEMVNSEEACKSYRGTREIIAPELVVRESTGPARPIT